MGKKKAEETASDVLSGMNARIQDDFVEQNNILSFSDYLDLVLKNPTQYTRSAYQYLVDMILYYGRRKDKDDNILPGWAIFDQPFNDGDGAVWGQAMVEQQLLNLLRGFSRVGRMDKLILLHGPNGSAKTSLTQCLHRGLENYSRTDEGAIYKFNWIFPEEKISKEKIGFTKDISDNVAKSESYAYLPEDRISATLSCPLRDNPVFLIPSAERDRLYDDLINSNEDFASHELAETIIDGDLSPTNKMIFKTLLTAYKGDYSKVLQHIQVERYYFSERYKIGAVTIEPQMSVDARIQQVTQDRSLSSLPPVLQNLNLYETAGHLIQGNHGIVEYSDLLKRPVDAFKYLLRTCEMGTINLDVALVYLDLVMIGSSNDKYLDAFKQLPDFMSFKGRMEFIKVPYLKNFEMEKRIYDDQLSLTSKSSYLAPHLTDVVAMWAVLTRLRKPNPENYPEVIQKVVEKLNPLEKAIFYTTGEAPDWTTVSQANELKRVRMKMMNEFMGEPYYEGGFGASPREGKMLLQNAVQQDREGCISVRQVFAEIQRLISDKSVYEWLQMEPDGDYGNQQKLIQYVKEDYIKRVDKELKIAMEMIEEAQYFDLLERYVEQASAWLHKKKVTDPISGNERDVDENLLKEVELIIAPSEQAKEFRQDVVSRVGAFALDNPDKPVDYQKIFRSQINKLEQHYFAKQQKRITKLHEDLLRYDTDREKELSQEAIANCKNLLDRMRQRFGYAPSCTREVVTMLIKTRYAEPNMRPEPSGGSSSSGETDPEGAKGPLGI